MTRRLALLLILSTLLFGQTSQTPTKNANTDHPDDRAAFGKKNNAKVGANAAPGAIQFSAPKARHHIKLQAGTAPGDASFDASYPNSTLFACVNNRMPERTVGDWETVIVFATGSCNFSNFLNIRGKQNGNGWDFEIDARRDGSYSMHVRFDF